jgi:environmental stress-induced protein Ves
VLNRADLHPFNVFDVDQLAVAPWRNGGGETREIAAQPSDGGSFAWRASIATIAQDGRFSEFPGVDRTITLLEGVGVRLLGDDLDHTLDRPGEPFAFPGDVNVRAALVSGSTRNLNIMTQRGSWVASVRTTTAPVIAAAGHDGVLYVMRGRWHGGRSLDVGQGVWWTADAATHAVGEAAAVKPLTDDAIALWADIRPL